VHNLAIYYFFRRANSVQNRMNLMRAKFQTLQVDDDNDPDGDITAPALINSGNTHSNSTLIRSKSPHSSQSIQ